MQTVGFQVTQLKKVYICSVSGFNCVMISVTNLLLQFHPAQVLSQSHLGVPRMQVFALDLKEWYVPNFYHD